jgi:pSer/pThr/pTyr-binding forkhead associated (FHA) protein
MVDASKNTKTMPSSAFLIVNSELFPLEREVINIGRKLDNHIVIHDPRISRNHAQLRVMEGQFVILDLNSTGGTFVNNQRVTKSVLYSGDSISLAGVMLKFVQDAPKILTTALDRTGPLPPLGFEEPPTQIMNRSSQNPAK